MNKLIYIGIISLFVTLIRIPVLKADTHLFFRFKGGTPLFVGGGSSPYDKDFEIEVKHRKGYTIGFSPLLHQSLWVAYRLKPEDVKMNVGRLGNFRKDEDLQESLSPSLYIGSGYDRGHLAPSGDMRYDISVSHESFWMGNISPQEPYLNRGSWKSLEQKIHNLVIENSINSSQAREVFIITGPIFTKKNVKDAMNATEPSMIVPIEFYKIYIYNCKAIAMIFNQVDCISRIVTIQEIEEKTGISFFPNLSEGMKDVFLQMYNGSYDLTTKERKN